MKPDLGDSGDPWSAGYGKRNPGAIAAVEPSDHRGYARVTESTPAPASAGDAAVNGDLGTIPAGLAAQFPAAAAQLEVYARSLATDGVVRGLLGPREVPRIWDRHIANCAAIEQLIPYGATVIDIGSGAGLPGLVLAIVRPDVTVTLVEPLLRRTTFLGEVVEALKLGGRVEVLRGRAQEFHGRLRADVVTARAVAALAGLVQWSWSLVAAGGSIVAMKGETATAEVEDARPVFQRLGIADSQVQVVPCASTTGTATAVVISHPHAPR
ncbi:MAG: hypothetical protein RL745_558 [Actinomycetota bacterium]